MVAQQQQTNRQSSVTGNTQSSETARQETSTESPLNTSMSPSSTSTLRWIAEGAAHVAARTAVGTLRLGVYGAVAAGGSVLGVGQGGPLQDFLNGWNNTQYRNKAPDKNDQPETSKKVNGKNNPDGSERETKPQTAPEPAPGGSREQKKEEDLVLSRQRSAA